MLVEIAVAIAVEELPSLLDSQNLGRTDMATSTRLFLFCLWDTAIAIAVAVVMD